MQDIGWLEVNIKLTCLLFLLTCLYSKYVGFKSIMVLFQAHTVKLVPGLRKLVFTARMTYSFA